MLFNLLKSKMQYAVYQLFQKFRTFLSCSESDGGGGGGDWALGACAYLAKEKASTLASYTLLHICNFKRYASSRSNLITFHINLAFTPIQQCSGLNILTWKELVIQLYKKQMFFCPFQGNKINYLCILLKITH